MRPLLRLSRAPLLHADGHALAFTCRAIGPEAASDLMGDMRTGAVVRVLGRLQPSRDRTGGLREDILDVVCHQVTIEGTRGQGELDPPYLVLPAASDAEVGWVGDGGAPPSSDEGLHPEEEAEAAEEGGDGTGWRRLGASQVMMVDSLESVRQAEAVLWQDAFEGGPSAAAGLGCVGLDAEWKPFGRGQRKTPVELLQISTRGRCFVLDMRALCRAPFARLQGPLAGTAGHNQDGVTALGLTAAEEATSTFLARLFGDESIVKVGFLFGNDLHRLQQSYLHLPCFGGHGRPVTISEDGESVSTSLFVPYQDPVSVPLRSYVEAGNMVRLCDTIFSTIHRASLSRLVETVFGRGLDKTEQLSPWDHRPLTRKQVRCLASSPCSPALSNMLLLPRLFPTVAYVRGGGCARADPDL